MKFSRPRMSWTPKILQEYDRGMVYCLVPDRISSGLRGYMHSIFGFQYFPIYAISSRF